MFQPNQSVGSYTLIRLLGRGGFGEVWLAEKRTSLLTRQVALKLPVDPNPDIAEIKKEAQTWLHAGHHPNVLPVIDAEVVNGQVMIASEYASGGSLKDWLAKNGGKAPSVSAAIEMITQILAGLEHLHALKPNPIIHRDLKPDNVLLQNGVPRLTDFGISRVLKTTALTQHSSGTPSYMPPEAFGGKYSAQSDLWAIGVMLYQMLSGKLPFSQNDIPSLYGAILTGKPAPLPPNVPQSVQAVIAKALAKDPAQRFGSAKAMSDALTNPNAKPSSATPKPNPQTTVPDPFVSTVKPDNPAVTRRVAFIVLGVGVLGVGGLGLLRWMNPYWMRTDTSPKDMSKDISKPQPPVEMNKPPTTKTNPKDGAEMIFIPAGEFTMGSSEGGTDGKPIHKPILDAYYLYKTPVTVAQYLKFCSETGHLKPPAPEFNPNWSKEDHPIVNVSWGDAQAYCKWAGVRLPTEAEWEKGARGTDGRKYPWGETFDTSRLRCSSTFLRDSGGTAPVDSHPTGASPYGLLDMAGNVWQWCSDWYDEDFYGSRSATDHNPENQSVGEKKFRVLRGGAWSYHNPDNFRCANRFNFYYYVASQNRSDDYGFRCASGL